MTDNVFKQQKRNAFYSSAKAITESAFKKLNLKQVNIQPDCWSAWLGYASSGGDRSGYISMVPAYRKAYNVAADEKQNLEISQYLSQLFDLFMEVLGKEFDRFGIELISFCCESIAPQREDYERLRKYKEALLFKWSDKICSNCGTKNDYMMKFCGECGSRI